MNNCYWDWLGNMKKNIYINNLNINFLFENLKDYSYLMYLDIKNTDSVSEEYAGSRTICRVRYLPIVTNPQTLITNFRL